MSPPVFTIASTVTLPMNSLPPLEWNVVVFSPSLNLLPAVLINSRVGTQLKCNPLLAFIRLPFCVDRVFL